MNKIKIGYFYEFLMLKSSTDGGVLKQWEALASVGGRKECEVIARIFCSFQIYIMAFSQTLHFDSLIYRIMEGVGVN